MTSRPILALTSRRDFLRSLIGKPYRRGGGGPEDYDCYGLARHVLHELFSIDLVFSGSNFNRVGWSRLTQPEDGALVIMGAQGKHVGVYLSNGILHAVDGVGVVFDDLDAVRFLRGFGKVRIYRAHGTSDPR